MASTTSSRGIDPKQPGETLDYDFNLTKWLRARNDTLATATVTCDDGDLTLGDTEMDDYIVKQWTSAGVHGVDYKLTCKAQTVGGRELEREMYVPVREK